MRLVLLTLAVCLAACDSATPEPPVTPGPPVMPEPPPGEGASVERLAPFPDLEVYEETGWRALDVDGRFQGNPAAGSVTLSLEPLTPGVVEADDALRVRPLAVGTARS
ncbi:MAG: hypothetical protein WBA11_14280, partial [Rubrivirga sp.]